MCIADLAFGPHPNRIFTWITEHHVKTRACLAVSQEIRVFSPVFPDCTLEKGEKSYTVLKFSSCFRILCARNVYLEQGQKIRQELSKIVHYTMNSPCSFCKEILGCLTPVPPS